MQRLWKKELKLSKRVLQMMEKELEIEEIIKEIKEKFRQKPEEYFMNLFLYRKEEIMNPEKFFGLKHLGEPIDKIEKDMNRILEILKTYISSEQDEEIEKVARLFLLYELEQANEKKQERVDSKEIEDMQEKNELRKRFEELLNSKSSITINTVVVEMLKENLRDVLNDIMETHVTTIGVLLSHLVHLHNLIVHDLRSGVAPNEDEKVWDYIDAINLITLEYGVLIRLIGGKGSSLGDGFVEYLLFKPIKELRYEPSIMLRVMPKVSWKSHLELIGEMEKR